ncbi:MAG: Clp protease N-terminal domain-containing protein, partial [Nitrospiraceae bacterium]|nr:Clp protease N-terminal domain-containing protein [Nitrospiraceae bacterium]
MAREEAEKHQNDYLGTEHIVLALVGDQDGVPV